MGIVEDVGAECDRNLVGKRVAIEPAIHCGHCEWCFRGDVNICPNVRFLGLPPTPGVFQEYISHPAHLLEPVPDEISDDGAVLLEPLAVVVHAFDLAKMRFGGRVAVLGSGSVGLLCVWMAAQLKSEVIFATDVLDYRLNIAKKMGATHTANDKTGDVVAQAAQITDGKGFDYVIEAASSDDTAEQMVTIAGPGAKLLVIGITPSDRLSFCHASSRRKGVTIIMVRRSRRTLGRAMAMADAFPFLEENLVTHHADLNDCEDILRRSAAYEDGIIKGIVNP